LELLVLRQNQVSALMGQQNRQAVRWLQQRCVQRLLTVV
jgi:hypothetical protein